MRINKDHRNSVQCNYRRNDRDHRDSNPTAEGIVKSTELLDVNNRDHRSSKPTEGIVKSYRVYLCE